MTLKELRRSRGMTQVQVASLLGVTQQSVQQIEAGINKPSPRTANRIREAFGITLRDVWSMFYENNSSTESA